MKVDHWKVSERASRRSSAARAGGTSVKTNFVTSSSMAVAKAQAHASAIKEKRARMAAERVRVRRIGKRYAGVTCSWKYG